LADAALVALGFGPNSPPPSALVVPPSGVDAGAALAAGLPNIPPLVPPSVGAAGADIACGAGAGVVEDAAGAEGLVKLKAGVLEAGAGVLLAAGVVDEAPNTGLGGMDPGTAPNRLGFGASALLAGVLLNEVFCDGVGNWKVGFGGFVAGVAEVCAGLPNSPLDGAAFPPMPPKGLGLLVPGAGGVAAGVVDERVLNSFGAAGVVDPNSDGA
jgi:hypothetical protein